MKDFLACAVAILLAGPCAAAETGAVVEGNTAFAFALYSRVASQPGNLFFSPYSISSVLAMASAGARGRTAVQMSQVLRLEGAGPQLHKAFGDIGKTLNQGGKSSGYELTVANALWGHNGAAFQEPFTALVESGYGAGLRQMDFEADAESGRKTINAWVEERTGGRIRDIIGRGVLNSLTRMVLTNAIYFKGKWDHQFKEKWTTDQPFFVSPGKEARVRLMFQISRFRHLDGGSFQVLEMPYKGRDLVMDVVLPKDRYGLAELEKGLSAEALLGWLGRLSDTRVEVHFPRFKMTRQLGLSEQLKVLGMTDAFDRDRADFSGINGKRPPAFEALYVSQVIHQAFVAVDEEGTEAAAATAGVMAARGSSASSEPPPVFRADHPFLFLIRDLRSGSILFLGRLAEPKGS